MLYKKLLIWLKWDACIREVSALERDVCIREICLY